MVFGKFLRIALVFVIVLQCSFEWGPVSSMHIAALHAQTSPAAAPGALSECKGACTAFVFDTHSKLGQNSTDQAVNIETIRFMNWLQEKYPDVSHKAFQNGEIREYRNTLLHARDLNNVIATSPGLDSARVIDGAIDAGVGNAIKAAPTGVGGAVASGVLSSIGYLGQVEAKRLFYEYLAYKDSSLIRLEASERTWYGRPQMMNKELSRADVNARKDPNFKRIYNDQIAKPLGLPLAGQEEGYYIAENPELGAVAAVAKNSNLETALASPAVQDKLKGLIREAVAPTEDEIKRQQDAAVAQKVTQTANAAGYMLETALNFTGHPREAKTFSTVFNGVMEIRKNVNDFREALETVNKLRDAGKNIENAKMLANMQGAMMTMNTVAIGMSIISSFSQQPKSETAIILDQLGQIADQIESLRKEMNGRFDIVDAKLDNLLAEVSRDFYDLKAGQSRLFNDFVNLSRRQADDTRRLEVKLKFADSELLTKLTAGSFSQNDFQQLRPATLPAADALARAKYLSEVASLSALPLYRSYFGGTLAGLDDYTTNEFFLKQVDTSMYAENVITSKLSDNLGLMFDAIEGISHSPDLSGQRTPNFAIWKWAAFNLRLLYTGRPDAEPKGLALITSFVTEPEAIATYLRSVRNQGKKYEKLASILQRGLSSGTSLPHQLLDRYRDTLLNEVTPALKKVAQEAANEVINRDTNNKIDGPTFSVSSKDNRVSTYCKGDNPWFNRDWGMQLSKTKSYPVAPPELIDAQKDFYSLNSLLRADMNTEPLCFFQLFVIDGRSKGPITGVTAVSPGKPSVITHVRRISGIVGSFDAIHSKQFSGVLRNIEPNNYLSLPVIAVAKNTTQYHTAWDFAGRNIQQFFLQHESPEPGTDWERFRNYLRGEGQFVPMSQAQMKFDPQAMTKLDEIVSNRGVKLRQTILAAISTRVRQEIVGGNSDLAKAVAKAGFYKHALRVALEFSVGPEMDKQESLWLQLNGPTSLIDSDRMLEIFGSAESLTRTMLVNQGSQYDGKKPYACATVTTDLKDVPIDCVAMGEFKLWSYHTNRIFENSMQTAGQALFPYLTREPQVVPFFDPAEVIFADQIGYLKWKSSKGKQTLNAKGYLELDGRDNGQIDRLQNMMQSINPQDYGTAAPVRLELKMIDQAIKAKASWF